jgi:hypothetical protein
MGVTGLDVFFRSWGSMQRFQVASLKTWITINADYNPIAEAESILAEDALNVPSMMGTGSLVGALAV